MSMGVRLQRLSRDLLADHLDAVDPTDAPAVGDPEVATQLADSHAWWTDALPGRVLAVLAAMGRVRRKVTWVPAWTSDTGAHTGPMEFV